MSANTFQMPMFNAWVPDRLRPWIYVLILVTFQLTGFIYLGSAAQITGATGLMHDDVMFIGLCNIVGVNMPFPLLFRFKFRFTNRQLLLNAALVILVCNLLALWLLDNDFSLFNFHFSRPNGPWRIVPLCILSYLSGFFKLCGTFECASNIQLWLTPKRDFRVFFPVLYIAVVGDIFLQGWLASVITYHYSWQLVNWLMIGLMLIVVLLIWTLTHNFRFMKPLPLLSVDWLGCVLWSLLMVEVVWLFNYGEFYNWWQGRMFRLGVVAFVVTLAMTLHRARRIRHPYIALESFGYKTLLPTLALYFVAEWMNTTPKVLGNAFTGGVLHWGMLTTSRFELIGWVGNFAGCLFTFWWMKGLRQKYTRLLFIGGAAMLLYQVMMYFYITPTLPIQRLTLPLFLRAFGYAIYFTALTIYIEELMPFQHFFMGLTITGFMRNGPVEAMMSGLYSFAMRHQVADAAARTTGLIDQSQLLMASIKEIFGWTCLLGCAFLVALLVYDVQPARSRLRRMPLDNVVFRSLRTQLGNINKRVRLFG